MRIRSGLLAAALLPFVHAQASACSVPSQTVLTRLRDAKVTGSLRVTGHQTAMLVAERVESGIARKHYRIRWERPSEGDDCPNWQPLYDHERGTYQLKRVARGDFLVLLSEEVTPLD